jgi:uncharacterized protein HemX
MSRSEYTPLIGNFGLTLVLVALISALVMIIALTLLWRHRRAVETSARKGLKAQLKAQDERLLLAEEKRRDVEAIKNRLEQEFTQYERQIGQYLRTVEHKAPGLEVASATIRSTLSELSTANNALHEVLTVLIPKSTGND